MEENHFLKEVKSNNITPHKIIDTNTKEKTPQYREEEEEIRNSMFTPAEDIRKFVIIKDDDARKDGQRFADMNYQTRIEILKRVLDIPYYTPFERKIEMKKFKKRLDKFYQVEITVKNEDDMNTLLDTNELGGCKVQVTENTYKNSIQGVIIDHDEELKDMDDDAIAAALSYPIVRSIKRFGGSKVIGISFKGQVLPEKVTFWNELNFRVKPSIPPPIRCFKCQAYGHRSSSCHYKNICFRCSTEYETEEDHDPKSCNEAPKCANCEGNHNSGHYSCEIHKIEKEWAKICSQQNIGRREAQQRYPEGKIPTTATVVAKQNTTLGLAQEEIRSFEEFSNKAIKRIEDHEIMKRLEQIEHAILNQAGASSGNQMQDHISERLTKLEKDSERLTALEQDYGNLRKKLDVQTKIIHQLQQDVKNKDEMIIQLEREKEQLIVEKERLATDADAALKLKIAELESKLQQSEKSYKKKNHDKPITKPKKDRDK